MIKIVDVKLYSVTSSVELHQMTNTDTGLVSKYRADLEAL